MFRPPIGDHLQGSVFRRMCYIERQNNLTYTCLWPKHVAGYAAYNTVY